MLREKTSKTKERQGKDKENLGTCLRRENTEVIFKKGSIYITSAEKKKENINHGLYIEKLVDALN